MMHASTDTSLIIPALVKALGEMTDIPKGRMADMGSYKYSFADLADVLGYLRPLLASHELAVMQMAHTFDGTAVTTTILHGSGQWIESDPLRLPAGTGAQSHGSAITFARRYSLLAMLGLATEDDDGAAASTQPAQAQKRATAPKTAAGQKGPSDAVTKRAMAMFSDADIKDRGQRLELTAYVCKRPVESWHDVTAKEADDVMGVLDRLIKGKVSLGFEDNGQLAIKEVA